jgi:hypothetical protein
MVKNKHGASKIIDTLEMYEASDELKGKDQSNKACIENKRGGQLGLISIYP